MVTGHRAAWLGWLSWPALLLGSLWAAAALHNDGWPLPLAIFAVTVANILAVAVLEVCLPLNRDWSPLRDRQIFNDIGHGLLGNELGSRVGAGLVAVTLAALLGGDSHGLWPDHWPLAAQVALAVPLADFVDYWKHRLLHRSRLLWRFHVLHHNPDRLHVMKAARLHFVEIVIRYAAVYLPLVLLGAPQAVLLWYAALMNFIGNPGHSNVRFRFPSWFHYLVVTPPVHHAHHGKERRLGDTNFSPLLPVWDLVFGTYTHPDQAGDYAVGVARDPLPTGFFGQLLRPFGVSFRSPRP